MHHRHPDADESVPYSQRADGYNADYRREYEAWYAGLSADERQDLKAHGLDRALIDYHVTETEADAIERTEIVNGRESSHHEESPTESARHLWEVVERIAILLIDAENVRLEADTLAFVAGFYARMGKSGTELASKYGLHRATWSKRCKQMQRRLGLPPSRGMKSERACLTYAQTNGAMKRYANGSN